MNAEPHDRRRMTAEEFWTWLTRALAVILLGFVLATVGIERTPWGAYLLLLGLFFGPEIVTGQLSINRRAKEGDERDDR